SGGERGCLAGLYQYLLRGPGRVNYRSAARAHAARADVCADQQRTDHAVRRNPIADPVAALIVCVDLRAAAFARRLSHRRLRRIAARMSTLDLVNLHKRFRNVDAVNHINLSVGNGEFLCILGPWGCGKSTALRMIAGFDTPTAGDVRIDGASVVEMPPNRRPTAMVFQKYTLWPHMKVYENIAFGLHLRRLPRAEIDRKVQGALDLVGLSSYGPRYPAQLSGGEQQRIALARALVLE